MSIVLVDTPNPGVGRIALNRADKRNALSVELREALLEALHALSADADIRAIVIVGAGGNFCAGGDLASLSDITPAAGRQRIQRGHEVVRVMLNSEKPIVCAVEGYAMGAGAGLAMAADTAVVDSKSVIGFPFLKVGLGPDFGVSFLLPRRVGPARARQLLLRAQDIRGADLITAGLADELAADGEVQVRAIAIAAQYAALPRLALALSKRQLRLFPQDFDAAAELEAGSQALCFGGDEFREGVAAFRDKRRPQF
ncbi:MAG: enoyl-CoA hydratase/isomerase family protein [Pseudolabrys sp.]|jgi:2-(1,2-epoxy-1,2-dihydrophenyl)acetyl-CoA isomerase